MMAGQPWHGGAGPAASAALTLPACDFEPPPQRRVAPVGPSPPAKPARNGELAGGCVEWLMRYIAMVGAYYDPWLISDGYSSQLMVQYSSMVDG